MYKIFVICIIVTLVSCFQEKQVWDGRNIERIERDVCYASGEMLDLSSSDKIWYLVRHAEKDTSDGKNPNLNDLGLERAARLADIFKGTQLDHIYTTYYNRCLQTADTVSQLKGMPMNIYKANEIKELITEIGTRNKNEKVLIVGHSNTIPATANLILGSQHFTSAIQEDVYDNFFIISQKDTVSQIYKFKF